MGSTVPSVMPWSLGERLRVIVGAEHVDELVRGLAGGEWWYFQYVLSANGINMYFKGEQQWEDDPTDGTAFVRLFFEREDDPDQCHVFAGEISRQVARDVAAGLAGDSSVLVPVTLNYLDEAGWQVVGEVPVYFEAEESYRPRTQAAAVPAPQSPSKRRGATVARRSVPARAARKGRRS